MLENKILRLFGEPRKCLRMFQLYQKEVSKLYTIKELKGVAKMRSKMCSQRLQNSTKTSSPKITAAGKSREQKRLWEPLYMTKFKHQNVEKCPWQHHTTTASKNSNQICKRVKERNKTNYGKQTS